MDYPQLKKKILIADDEQDVIMILGRILSSGYDLETHSNSNSVHDRLFNPIHKSRESLGLDMLILDNSMGGDHKGADLAGKAVLVYPSLPILVTSGEDIAHDYPHIVQAGVKIYRKPYDLVYLKGVIKELLHGEKQ